MEPIEFLKVCLCIVYVVISFAIYVKVLFAFIDWLVERIGKAALEHKTKCLLIKLRQNNDDLTEEDELNE